MHARHGQRLVGGQIVAVNGVHGRNVEAQEPHATFPEPRGHVGGEQRDARGEGRAVGPRAGLEQQAADPALSQVSGEVFTRDRPTCAGHVGDERRTDVNLRVERVDPRAIGQEVERRVGVRAVVRAHRHRPDVDRRARVHAPCQPVVERRVARPRRQGIVQGACNIV